MALEFIRIDDRLIHGQIVTIWLQHVGANAIVVANNAIAADSFTAKMIGMAAPANIKVACFSLNDTVSEVNEGSLKDNKVLVLVKNVEDAHKLHELGLSYTYLNVGGMASVTGSKVIYKNISATDKQMELLEELKTKGVEVEFKVVANEKGMKL